MRRIAPGPQADRRGVGQRLPWSGRPAAGLLLPIALILAACTSTDPTPERLQAAEHAGARAGIDAYVGPDDALFRARLDSILDDGIDEAEAVEIALHGNPMVLAAFARIAGAKAGLVQARLLPNPKISASVLYPTLPGPEKKTFTAILPLADIWTIYWRGESAEAVLESSVLDAARIAVDVAGNTRVAFRRAQGWMRARDVAMALLGATDRAVQVAETRAEAGELSPLEVESTRVPAIDSQTLVLDAQRELELARLEVAHWIGLPADPRALNLLPREPAEQFELPEAHALLATARSHRLDARVAQLRVEAADAEVDREQGLRLRDLSVGFSWERLLQTMRGFNLSLELPLFDQNQAQIALACARADEARRDRTRVDQLIEFEVLAARQRVCAAGEKVRHLREVALPHADLLVAGSSRRLEAGDDVLELWLRSEQARFERQRQFALALVDMEVAVAGLARVLGTSFGTVVAPDLLTSPTASPNPDRESEP